MRDASSYEDIMDINHEEKVFPEEVHKVAGAGPIAQTARAGLL